jgi:hypothetical protein
MKIFAIVACLLAAAAASAAAQAPETVPETVPAPQAEPAEAAAAVEAAEPRSAPGAVTLKGTVFRVSRRRDYVVVFDRTFRRYLVYPERADIRHRRGRAPVTELARLRPGDPVIVRGQVILF